MARRRARHGRARRRRARRRAGRRSCTLLAGRRPGPGVTHRRACGTRCATTTLLPGSTRGVSNELARHRPRPSRSAPASCSSVQPDRARRPEQRAPMTADRALRSPCDRWRARRARAPRRSRPSAGARRRDDHASSRTTRSRSRSRCSRAFTDARPASTVKVLPAGDAGAGAQPGDPHQGPPDRRRALRRRQHVPLAGRSTTGIFEPYESPRARRRARATLAARPDGTGSTPIDHGDVCVNYDKEWFARARPRRADDARRPRRSPRTADLLVVENPATSSPGLAFLLATIAAVRRGRLARLLGAACAPTT